MKRCKSFKKYRAVRPPTCGCDACKEKWDARILALKKGTIHKKGVLFLRTNVGEVTSGKNKYELSLINGHTPAVRSEKTGNYYSLSWVGLVMTAIDAGIDEVMK